MHTNTNLKIDNAKKRLAHVAKIAHQLFERHGFERVGIREIAKEAGISPIQVYRLGVDKADLLAEAILLVNEEIISSIELFDGKRSEGALAFIEIYLLGLYKKNIAHKGILSKGVTFGWKWSTRYEVLISNQLMEIFKPIQDALYYYEYDEIEARCYAIQSLYHSGYRQAVINNADAKACINKIKPSLAICLGK
jgi:AcrR family transcriptional regulator